jgi:hypothetical protein
MSHRSAASLSELPQELMDEITSLVPRRADVSSLSMTSKSIRAATLPLLFHVITMVWFENDTVERVEGDPLQNNIPRIDLLLRVLLENPRFAEYVLKIDLQLAGYRKSRYHKAPHKPQLPPLAASTSYQSLVQNALRRMGLHQMSIHEELVHGISKNDFDAVVALILLLCPRMTSLNLGLDVLLFNRYLSTVMNHALPQNRTSALRKLKSLKLGRSLLDVEKTAVYRVEWPRRWPKNALTLPAYLPLFYLPALRDAEMSLPWLGYGVKFAWPVLPPPQLSSLRTLHLPECGIEPHILHQILLSTPQLVDLKYDCWMFYSNRFDALAFTAALKSVKNTLACLEVKLEFWSNETVAPGEEEEKSYVEQQCLLKDMVALATVSISACIILGWRKNDARALASVLPPTIVKLKLLDNCFGYESFEWSEENLMMSLRDFLDQQRWRAATPRLQEISIAHTEWDNVDELIELGEQNGVVCSMHSSQGDLGLAM